MENNIQANNAGSGGDPVDATRMLDDLAADRAKLVERMKAPGWLYPAAGLLAAIYIASPAIEADVVRRVVAGVALGGIAFLVWGFQRATGVKVSRAGLPAQWTLVLHVLAVLLLLVVSFVLESLDLTWWIVLASAAGFLLTVVLGKRFHSQYRNNVRRGR